MRIGTRVAAIATAGASALAIVASSGSALADPPRGVTPSPSDIVGVGSDTTQFVMDYYASQYNKTPASAGHKLYSFDAVKPGSNPPVTGDPIVTKQGCAPIARPNGSSAGIAALLADTKNCIDFARSSRAKNPTGEASLAFFAFARDGVTWAAVPSSHTPKSLTPTQLRAIYACSTRNWNQIDPSLPSNTIQPYLPQVGSGTRAFFLGAIGLTDSTVGACVNQKIEENNGRPLTGKPNALVPYSIARWIAQTPKAKGGAGAEPDIRGGTTLRKINGKSPTVRNAATGRIMLNRGFDPSFLRQVYNVVKKSANGSVDAKYLALFGPSGYLCAHQSFVTKFGFGTLGSTCGAQS